MKPDKTLLQKAVRLLGRRSHSRHQLSVKLRRHSSSDEVSRVLDRLEKIGYLDDTEFARQRSQLGRHRGWSNLRIRVDLRKQGVSESVFGPVVEALQLEAPEEDALQLLAEKWMARRGRPCKASDLKKLFDACGRAGYPQHMIRAELAQLFVGLDWE